MSVVSKVDPDDLTAAPGFTAFRQMSATITSIATGVSPVVQVKVMAANEEDFRAWEGWCHSRFRQLVMLLQSQEGAFVSCVGDYALIIAPSAGHAAAVPGEAWFFTTSWLSHIVPSSCRS